MLIRKPADISSSEITSKTDYLNRRTFMTGAAAAGVAALAAERIRHWADAGSARAAEKLQTVKSPLSMKGETPTSFQDITHYNNFYEFGTDKGDPARNAGAMHTRPGRCRSTGLVKQKKPSTSTTLMKLRPMEERIYRFRCVEAWSMVIPWDGYPLSEFIKQCDPLPAARSTCSSYRSPIRSRCRNWISPASTGRTPRACAWTRRCTRSRC